ncbi:MAG: hypothetical protein OXR84_11720 [Magnetovibrio sp.]|nr:hypothetical protein [Magnetovibrio sp.]
MEPAVLILVLGSAVLHASWNALVKSGGQPFLRLGAIMGTSGLIGWLFTPFVPFPAPEVWPFLITAALVQQVYFVAICLGYRFGDLSHVYPVQRGMAPFLVAIGAWWFAGETVGAVGLTGVLLIGVAVLSLALTTTRWPDDAKALSFAVVAGLALAGYSVVNGMGARTAATAGTYIVWLLAIGDTPFRIVTVALNIRRSTGDIRRHLVLGAACGVLTAGAYAIVVWAMTVAPITYVTAVRETSVIIAAWIGSRLLGEPFGAKRIAAAALVVIGVMLLQAGGAG